MNITQMEYLVEIVQSNFNITNASQKLYVSQSAISQFIKTFEEKYEMELFVRRNSRMVDLTPAGEKIYRSALDVLQEYYDFENTLKYESTQQKGTIKIGVHPTMLRLFFTKFIPRFILENPDANIEIVEGATLDLREMLINQSVHVAVLVSPTDLKEEEYEEHQLMRTEIVAFMDSKHPLSKKRIIKWKDLESFPFVTYYDQSKTYDLIKDNLRNEKINSNLLFRSSSWDYMIESVIDNEHISILPTVYFHQFSSRIKQLGIIEKRFEKPISYIPVLVRPVKKVYTPVESFVFNSILERFHYGDYSLKYDFLEDSETD